MHSISARRAAVTGHQSDIAWQLRAAWLALDPPTDMTDELGQNVFDKIIGGLVIIAAGGAGDHVAGREFRWASRATSVDELDRLAEVCRIGAALRTAIAGLHKPAIVALADRHILRGQLMGYAATSDALVAEIEQAKKQLPTDQAEPHAQPDGRPRKMRAQVVAGLVIAGYRELFGDEAQRAVGGAGLPALVAAIFKIMRIKAQPKAAIVAAARRWPRSGPGWRSRLRLADPRSKTPQGQTCYSPKGRRVLYRSDKVDFV